MFWRRLNDTRRVGRRGEKAAARHLRSKGYRIIGRNVRLKHGEVDLVAIAPDRRTIVIVEVKSRLDGSRIPPEASVTHTKQRKLMSLTEALMARNRWGDRPVRIDVVAVTWTDGACEIRHFENAVRSSSVGPRASHGRPTRA